MSTTTCETLVEEFERLIGDKPYLSGTELVELGLFGSPSGLSVALKRGRIPSIRIGEHRIVVPRSAVIEYFRANLNSDSGVCA